MTETKLKLLQLDPDIWYSVFDSKGNNLTEVIKELIDGGWPLTFNEAYTLFKREYSL